MAIKVATDATFEAEVLHNDRPVVVDFWAAWCGPCKLVAPEMEKLAAKYEGSIDIVKVDVDANPGLSRAFNIMSIPTIAFFAPGKQPMGVVGFRPAEQLETQFNLASFPKVETASAAEAASDGATAAEAPAASAATNGASTGTEEEHASSDAA
jgi:thioredoxin 1